MKIQPQIEALEKLSSLDAELSTLDEELVRERESLGSKKAQLKALEERLASSRASIEDMERVRNELLMDARQMNTQMERSREKLSRSRSEREVNAAQREIEELRKLYRDREGEVEKLSGLCEQAREEARATTAERDAIVGELGSNEGQITSRLAVLEQQVAEKLALRKGMIPAVQPALYRRYELIRKKRGSGIAHVTDGTCSACHMRVSPMMFQQLMRGEDFQQCPSCNRIVYYKAPVAAESAESQSGGP